jgi:hypothetical protein
LGNGINRIDHTPIWEGYEVGLKTGSPAKMFRDATRVSLDFRFERNRVR